MKTSIQIVNTATISHNPARIFNKVTDSTPAAQSSSVASKLIFHIRISVSASRQTPVSHSRSATPRVIKYIIYTGINVINILAVIKSSINNDSLSIVTVSRCSKSLKDTMHIISAKILASLKYGLFSASLLTPAKISRYPIKSGKISNPLIVKLRNTSSHPKKIYDICHHLKSFFVKAYLYRSPLSI